MNQKVSQKLKRYQIRKSSLPERINDRDVAIAFKKSSSVLISLRDIYESSQKL